MLGLHQFSTIPLAQLEHEPQKFCSLQSFDETVIQASQLAVDLGFPDKVVAFEWSTEKNMDCICHVMEEVKPQLLQFLEMLCLCSTKVHIIAVNDGALLLVKSSMKFEHKLGQAILTKLHRLRISTHICWFKGDGTKKLFFVITSRKYHHLSQA